jgi:hypothetical protein
MLVSFVMHYVLQPGFLRGHPSYIIIFFIEMPDERDLSLIPKTFYLGRLYTYSIKD